MAPAGAHPGFDEALELFPRLLTDLGTACQASPGSPHVGLSPSPAPPAPADSPYDFTKVLQSRGIQFSMDGMGRWVHNASFVRLWRSVKYEDVYPHAYDAPGEANTALERYFPLLQRAPAAPGA